MTRDKQDAVLERLLSQATLSTVVQFRGQLEQISRSLGSAIFDRGECAGCQHNSGNQQALFGEAIASGHCTHGSCFDAKTEASLGAKKASLSDEYPTTRIVRPGENFTLLRLVAEGDTGVGEEQAKACRACKNFGAAISAVPGKLGTVYPDLCFDATCNAKKVAARINRLESQFTGNTMMLASQLEQLLASGCIENFRIAAGDVEGLRVGWFFADSDAYKWLDAAARILRDFPDPRLAELVDGFIALLAKTQMPDGYLFTYNQVHFPGTRWHNLQIEHELYCHGHLIEAGVSHYQASGRTDLLAIAAGAPR